MELKIIEPVSFDISQVLLIMFTIIDLSAESSGKKISELRNRFEAKTEQQEKKIMAVDAENEKSRYKMASLKQSVKELRRQLSQQQLSRTTWQGPVLLTSVINRNTQLTRHNGRFVGQPQQSAPPPNMPPFLIIEDKEVTEVKK